MLDIETLKSIISNCKTDKQILNTLDNNSITYENVTNEYGYFNIRIPQNEGYLRICKNKKEYMVQNFTKVKMVYSGIPTFFSTNSCF
jgi:hypothetical protein